MTDCVCSPGALLARQLPAAGSPQRYSFRPTSDFPTIDTIMATTMPRRGARALTLVVLGASVDGALGCIPDPDTPFITIGRDAVRAMAHADPISPIEAQFLKVPSNVSARSSLKHLTSKPHVAGTPGDHEMAVFMRDQLKEAGFTDAHIDPQRVLLSYPIDRSLDLVDEHGGVLCSAPLSEAILPNDPTSDTWWRNHTFNGYSPSGNATAPLVYANFGFPEDFEALLAAGVQVKGSVVLMRYGKCFRGLKAMNAEKYGAVAALIYSDPEQDGYEQERVPQGQKPHLRPARFHPVHLHLCGRPEPRLPPRRRRREGVRQAAG